MPAHTAGPWHSTLGATDTGAAYFITSCANPFECYEVVRVRSVYPTRGQEAEAAANASLITAAPDLYAALRGLHDAYVGPVEIGTDGKQRMWHAITQARDAMAKAESRP